MPSGQSAARPLQLAGQGGGPLSCPVLEAGRRFPRPDEEQPCLPIAQVLDKARKLGPRGVAQTSANALPTLPRKQAVQEPRHVSCCVPCDVLHNVLREGPKDTVNRKQGVLLAPHRCAGGRAVGGTAARVTSAGTATRLTSATPCRMSGAEAGPLWRHRNVSRS